MVCLSEYLPLRSVYILGIKVQGFVLRRDQESPCLIFKIMLLRPTCEAVVLKVSSVVTMKSINMYIVPDSSSVLLIRIGKQNVKIKYI